MLTMTFELKPDTEKKVRRILDRYKNKETFFQDMIGNQIADLKSGLHNIELDLKEFEDKYNLTSPDFYRSFENGEIDDREDFMIWSGIYEMKMENLKQLAELE